MSTAAITDTPPRTAPDEASLVPALAVHNVSHAYGTRQALQDVSLTVAQSRFTALLGLNGAGKTTLFSLITRLYDTRHGSIEVLGHRVSREPGRALRLLGVVFQARTLDLDISVMDNLLYHAALHGIGRREARKRALAALQEIELADRAKDAVRRLSGGQMRRIEIARALLHRPRVLVLDEPTVGLDVASRAAILRHVRSLVRERGVAVLWATHLLDEVATDDAVVVLHRGRVLAAGDVTDVVASSGAADMRSAFIALTGAAPENAGVSITRTGDRTLGFTLGQYLICLRGIAWREALRFLNQRERFVSALVRPLVWLFIFAAGFRQILGVSIIPPYETYVLYEVYVTPGLMAMIQLFNGMQSSLSMVYDREMGNMRMLLVSPFPRWFLLTGKLLASTVVSISQVYAYLVVAWLWGIEPPIWGYITVLPALALSGMMLGALGMLLSSVIRQLENFAGVMNFVIFPMFFASSALYPLWLVQQSSPVVYTICRLNPFTYAVELIRFALYMEIDWTSLAVVVVMTIVFTTGAIIAYDPARGLIARRGGGGA